MPDNIVSPTISKTASNNPCVLVFDSGVGGLTIAHEIQQCCPAVNLIYLSDNEAFPYGLKSADYLIPRVEQVLTACLERHSADLIVIACNTASTVALPHIRSHFDIPVVGVVPAIKPAAALSKTSAIGLLATPGTIQRSYTQDLINSYARHCNIVKIGSNRLVQIAEEKLRGIPVNRRELEEILMPFIEPEENLKLDTIVLACTHFPLLKKELISIAPDHWTWLDSGEAIARRVDYLLAEKGYKQLAGPRNNAQIAITTGLEDIKLLSPILAQFGFADFVRLQLPSS